MARQILSPASGAALYGRLAAPPQPALVWDSALTRAELRFQQPSPLPSGITGQLLYFYTLTDEASGSSVAGHAARQIAIVSGDGSALTPYVSYITGVGDGEYTARVWARAPALGGAATHPAESAASAIEPFGERGIGRRAGAARGVAGTQLKLLQRLASPEKCKQLTAAPAPPPPRRHAWNARHHKRARQRQSGIAAV